MSFKKNVFYLLVIILFTSKLVEAQFPVLTQWTPDGEGYYKKKDGGIVKVNISTNAETVAISKLQLTTISGKVIDPSSFTFNNDNTKVLLFTNTSKVWRYNTRGDYWVLDIKSKKLTQLGINRPAQSLMYAKFSPNGKKVAYVSGHNLFVETIGSRLTNQLTFGGTRKLINGTFDWVYEEEFGCRDGFRWSPDGTQIAYWQVDANQIKDYQMLNTTDGNYSKVIPVEYPKVGEAPSPTKKLPDIF